MQPQNTQSNQPSIQDQNKKRRLWAFLCLFGPTSLIVISLLVYALANLLLGSNTTPVEGEVFASTPLWKSILNILLYLVGFIATLTWLPGIIIGIIIFATPKR